MQCAFKNKNISKLFKNLSNSFKLTDSVCLHPSFSARAPEPWRTRDFLAAAASFAFFFFSLRSERLHGRKEAWMCCIYLQTSRNVDMAKKSGIQKYVWKGNKLWSTLCVTCHILGQAYLQLGEHGTQSTWYAGRQLHNLVEDVDYA